MDTLSYLSLYWMVCMVEKTKKEKQQFLKVIEQERERQRDKCYCWNTQQR